MVTRDRMLMREGSRYWWLFLVAGILWLLIAWAVLRANATSLSTVGVLVGVVFILAGVNEVMSGAAVGGGWGLLHYLVAVFFLLGGLWSFIRPVDTFFALASVLGLILLVQGGFDIARSLAFRGVDPNWWIGLLTGVLLILLAFWVSSSDRVFNLAARTYLILFWVGFMAIFRGLTQIVFAFGIRHVGKTLDDIGTPARPLA